MHYEAMTLNWNSSNFVFLQVKTWKFSNMRGNALFGCMLVAIKMPLQARAA
jgi:hypothetical protein